MNRPILNYHGVESCGSSPDDRWTVTLKQFRSQLDVLEANGLQGVSLADALRSRSPNQVALTFDDGYRNFVTEVVPELSSRGFGATLYVVTGDVGGTAGWPGGAGKHLASWDQLRAVDDLGFEIGAHSHTHPQLDLLPRRAVEDEVKNSMSELRQNLGHDIQGFCYPHGFYSKAVRSAVVDAGFSYACAVRHKMSRAADDRFALARIVVERSTSTTMLQAWLAGNDLRRGGVRVERPMAAAFRSYRRLRMARTSSWSV